MTDVADDKLITTSRSVSVLAASGWAALSAFAVTIIASRVLTTADYTQFLVYWSVLFGCFQVLGGLQNEATRAVGAAEFEHVDSSTRSTGRVFAMTLVLAGGVALAVLLLGPVWATRLGVGVLVLVVSAVVVLSYGCHLTLVGVLAGRHQWGTMAALSATEATVRIVFLVAVALLLPGLVPMELAAALAALTWLVFAAVVPRARGAVLAHGDVGLKRLVANGGWAMLAAVATAVLVNGFPAIVRVALGGDTPDLASILLGIQITRAPLMMPLVAFQGVVIAGFVTQRTGRLRALLKPLLAVIGIGAGLAVLVGLIGPWLMRLLFGPQYLLSSLVLGRLAFAAVSLALLTVCGAATIAIGEHRGYLAGWIVGAAATVILLFVLPQAGVERVIAAVQIGPLFGVVVHLLAIRARDRAARAETVAQ